MILAFLNSNFHYCLRFSVYHFLNSHDNRTLRMNVIIMIIWGEMTGGFYGDVEKL